MYSKNVQHWLAVEDHWLKYYSYAWSWSVIGFGGFQLHSGKWICASAKTEKEIMLNKSICKIDLFFGPEEAKSNIIKG